MTRPKIVFLVGGVYHPAAEQAQIITDWLGPAYETVICAGVAAFEALDDAALFVPLGSHFTGMTDLGERSQPYSRPTDAHKAAFERYVASGRPLLVQHGGIVSYNDWPRFGELLGFTWVRGVTNHPPIGEISVRILPTNHPIIAGVDDFTLIDELYRDILITPGLGPTVHAESVYDGRIHPMILTAEGGRVAGAGKTVYLANGHDQRAFECPALRQLWLNALRWLLDE
ncbi:ThuA domain-containing protein [Chloroflexota bacterium]